MNYKTIDERDNELIAKAKAKIEDTFEEKHHRLVTAVLTEEGNTYYGINLQLDRIRRASACSDSGAISNAVLNKEKPILIVAVRKPAAVEPNQETKVVNPCGLCREMLTDYYPDINVIVTTPEGIKKCTAIELMPLKYGM